MPQRQLSLPDVDHYLTSDQIAEALGIHPVTVRRWRARNKAAGFHKYGPPFEVRRGRVFYLASAFMVWRELNDLLPVADTPDTPVAATPAPQAAPKTTTAPPSILSVEDEIQLALGE